MQRVANGIAMVRMLHWPLLMAVLCFDWMPSPMHEEKSAMTHAATTR